MTNIYKWEDVQRELLTEHEIAASDERARRLIAKIEADRTIEASDDSQ